ncbi:uncharacterized protein BJ212DRAFT_1357654 [Suillus subaureus]|uniref:Uncharacterized protein n=1 Tax=Suillus subaureus TaxID=48587 RepID=A0A9P7EA83_9AGAM|nr:uncharacterized protein BJ212DRAFT_1357654 [Suillus subaureus]KAG1815638.1 hypothetical protein BJ212DRAFT_1357654 [Suillus subaureus]
MSSPEAHVGVYPDTVQPDRGTNQDGRLHSKIVEILASTTNGCIEELGLHPTMIEKLQRATQLIHSLQEDNGRLYQDNCQLTATIQTLKEHAARLSANPNTQLQQFTHMQERIRTLESEYVALTRKNQEILLSVNKGTSHQHLIEELDYMKAYTNRVCRDMQILQDKYTMAKERSQSSPGVLSPSNSVSQVVQPRIPTPSDVHQRRVSAEGAPRLQPSRLPQQQFQQQAQYSRQIRPQVQHSLPPHHAHQAYTQRRVSDGVQNPYPPQPPIPMSQRWKLSPPASAPPMFGARSPTEFAHMPPISAPVNLNRPQQPPFTHSHMHTSQAVYRNVSAPLVAFDLHPKLHTATSRPTLSVDLTGEDEKMTEQARGGWVDRSSGLKRTNSVVDGSMAQDIELMKRQRTAEPTTHSPQDAIVNVNPEPNPASPDTVVGSKPTSPVLPSLSAPLPKENMDAASEGQVGVTNDEVAVAVTPSDTAVGSNPTSPSSVTPSPAQETPGAPPSGDNLRPVEACVYLIYEQDAEVVDGFFCGRCLDRFQMKMIPEPPDVLVNPKVEDLLMHCMQEHPTIWEDLRHKRDLEALAPPPS